MVEKSASLTWPAVWLVLGLAVLGSYAYARENGVADIGAEGDIGGGLLVLLGLLLVGVGVVAGARRLRGRRRRIR